MAVYLGEPNEDNINNMSLPFFNNVLTFLGKKVNYDAVVNYAGNSFAKDSWKLIQEANPMAKQKKIGNSFFNMLNSMVPVVKAGAPNQNKDIGDISWAE